MRARGAGERREPGSRTWYVEIRSVDRTVMIGDISAQRVVINNVDRLAALHTGPHRIVAVTLRAHTVVAWLDIATIAVRHSRAPRAVFKEWTRRLLILLRSRRWACISVTHMHASAWRHRRLHDC